MKKAAPLPQSDQYNAPNYCTSKRGRRAIASLWNASRTVSGAALTGDDLALINEVLAEIRSAIGAQS
ncbi:MULTISPECIES: hypothetical protein [Acidithiobacillus]|jgi:hypothetical protein|uniref:hypothetical protein n=1 Tax=Acidithiobacillus TaxID=119977 RepID=UPI001C06FA6F|nr:MULTISPECIES: hypothetical protein [Acidithiobacillus]MBU2749878.1 hypothetical protein [Acidithiobacillus thiooxidans]MBU2836875.1 hypothetical protein [Acidithiobacillus thiooxidans]MBU2850769.1 hypothetical protein [Acidithiobacillus ferrivorans]MDA8177158.1 hypothetical protein [Acidithiobacillus sp.]